MRSALIAQFLVRFGRKTDVYGDEHVLENHDTAMVVDTKYGKSSEDREIPTRTVSTTEALRSGILAGDFRPGERMYEVTLSEQLNVSRTPIREALKLLAGEGLLDHIPNRGYYVREYSTDDIVQAYEIRAALEGLAARRAAQLGMEQEERAIIEKALSDGQELLSSADFSPADRSRYGEINSAFHSAVHTASRSRMLRDMLRQSQQIAPSSHRNVVAFEHADVQRRFDDHYRIYEAILCRDSGRAELLMRGHVESVKLSLLRTISRESAAEHKPVATPNSPPVDPLSVS